MVWWSSGITSTLLSRDCGFELLWNQEASYFKATFLILLKVNQNYKYSEITQCGWVGRRRIVEASQNPDVPSSNPGGGDQARLGNRRVISKGQRLKAKT